MVSLLGVPWSLGETMGSMLQNHKIKDVTSPPFVLIYSRSGTNHILETQQSPPSVGSHFVVDPILGPLILPDQAESQLEEHL
jgi:hypothetical protein